MKLKITNDGFCDLDVDEIHDLACELLYAIGSKLGTITVHGPDGTLTIEVGDVGEEAIKRAEQLLAKASACYAGVIPVSEFIAAVRAYRWSENFEELCDEVEAGTTHFTDLIDAVERFCQ